MYKTLLIKNIQFLCFLLCFVCFNTAFAATSTSTQAGTQNSGVTGIDALPGIEVTPEQMQKYFPAPLGGDAKSMPFTPNVAPVIPVLPMQPSQKTTSTPPTPSKRTPSIPTTADTLPDFLRQGQSPPLAPPKPNPTGQLPLTPPSSGTAGAPLPTKQSSQQGESDQPSLESMVGQMIMAGFTGTDLENDAPILKLIREGKVGGVFLEALPPEKKENAPLQSDHAPLAMVEGGKQGLSPKETTPIKVPLQKQGNIASPTQLRMLVATLQRAVPENAFPLWIAVEQEGGTVQSLRKDLGFEGLAAAAHLGQGSVENTEIAARRAGIEMASLGINFVLGPAGDVNINPLSEDIGKRFRSFGPSPAQVAAHVAAFSKGLSATKVLPCIRNFPGTGSVVRGFNTPAPTANQGTNFMHSILDMSASWNERELSPYAKNVKIFGAVQPAFIYLRRFDSLHPAPLSRRILGELLREQLGFNGIVLSQDLRILEPFFSLENSILEAVLAGTDILLITEPAANVQAASSMPGLGDLGALNALGSLSTLADGKVINEIIGTQSANTSGNSAENITKNLLRQSLGKVLPGAFQANVQAKPTAGIATQATLVYTILLKLVQSGRISESRIRQSWQRIHTAKKNLGL